MQRPDRIRLCGDSMMRFVTSDSLTEDEVRIRTDVFMTEQGFQVEFDDDDAVSKHLVLYEDDVPVAVCRIIPGKDGECHIGRIAVVREYRGKGIGSVMVTEAEDVARSMGFGESLLSAHVRAKGFYETLGYEAFGDEYLDEYCPHVMMRKRLRTVTDR